ncbi:MAG: PA2779 family protein [Gammaproteobacteria bacterium]|nr:PA2779 family protein [Gammaproteobacteria bacterium]
MEVKNRFKKIVSLMVLMCFTATGFSQSVLAGIVKTTDLVDKQMVQAGKQRIYDLLARDDVRSQLIAMGVSPEDAVKRVANMKDEEVSLFAEKMQELPAGGDSVLGVLVFLFLVLLVTDILGYTDIFPFVKKPAKK